MGNLIAGSGGPTSPRASPPPLAATLYPDIAPLPPGDPACPASIYVATSQYILDYHTHKLPLLSPSSPASLPPVDPVDFTARPCTVCDYRGWSAAWGPKVGGGAKGQPEEAEARVAHSICRAMAKTVNSIMVATTATHLVLLVRMEDKWSAALTSRRVAASETGTWSREVEEERAEDEREGEEVAGLRAKVRFLAEGYTRWQRWMPQSIVNHVLATRDILTLQSSDPAHAASPLYSDPFFASFTTPPSLHAFPMQTDQGFLYGVLLLLSTSPTAFTPPSPFIAPHVPGLRLLCSQIHAVHVNTLLMSLLERTNRSLESVVSSRTADIQRELEERRSVEAQLIEAKRLAELSAAVKTEFLSNMSHEIRTPMNAVLGAVRLLLSTGLTSEQSHYLQLIKTSGTLLLSLINDILDINRIESGKLTLECREFHLTDCLETAVHLCYEAASEKGLDMAQVVERSVPRVVEGDGTRLSQIVINLLSNATKFTDRGYVMLNCRARDMGPAPPPAAAGTGVGEEEGEGVNPMTVWTSAAGESQREDAATERGGQNGSISLDGDSVAQGGALVPVSAPPLFRAFTAPSSLSLPARLDSTVTASASTVTDSSSSPLLPSTSSSTHSTSFPSFPTSPPTPLSLRRLAEIEIKVTDTGIGIPPAVLSRLFQVFTQGDPSIVRRHGGSGLGLAISQRLAEKMGGRIRVESEVGVGSSFTLTWCATCTLPSVHHPLLLASAAPDVQDARSELLQSTAPTSLSSPLPLYHAWSLSTVYANVLYSKRCLIVCSLPASTRAYQSLCAGFGVAVASTTSVELAFVRTKEEEAEEEEDRRRVEEAEEQRRREEEREQQRKRSEQKIDRRRRRLLLPSQRSIDRTTTTVRSAGAHLSSSSTPSSSSTSALASPSASYSHPLLRQSRLPATPQSNDSDSSAVDSDGAGSINADESDTTPLASPSTDSSKYGGRAAQPKIISPRLTLLVPPLVRPPASESSMGGEAEAGSLPVAPPPDIVVIVTHPALERERQLELTRVVRSLHRMCDAYERAIRERRGEGEDARGRRKRRRSVAGGARGCMTEEERRQVSIVEIRKPAKSTFVLKAMAKMLMKRDKEHSEEEKRRREEEDMDSMAGDGHGAQKVLSNGQAIVDEDDVDDEEEEDIQDQATHAGSRKRARRADDAEDMHISEMEDDEASDEDVRQQRKRSHYRHNSPLPPLGEELAAAVVPPSLPSPPSLSPHKMHVLAALPGSPSPSSPLMRPVRPSSRSRPLPTSNVSSASSGSVPASVELCARETRRPVSLIQPISQLYPLRLLLAEDNHINVRLMCMLLGKLGYNKVNVALNGKEVLKALACTKGWRRQASGDGGEEGGGEEEVYDCVLMDCQMDEMDGIDCTVRIRQHETGHKKLTSATLPHLGHYHYICAQTANVSAQYRDMCSTAGMDAFLSKPVAVEQLRDVLASAWQFQNERRRRCREMVREWKEMQNGAAVATRGLAGPEQRSAVETEVDLMRQEVAVARDTLKMG